MTTADVFCFPLCGERGKADLVRGQCTKVVIPSLLPPSLRNKICTKQSQNWLTVLRETSFPLLKAQLSRQYMIHSHPSFRLQSRDLKTFQKKFVCNDFFIWQNNSIVKGLLVSLGQRCTFFALLGKVVTCSTRNKSFPKSWDAEFRTSLGGGGSIHGSCSFGSCLAGNQSLRSQHYVVPWVSITWTNNYGEGVSPCDQYIAVKAHIKVINLSCFFFMWQERKLDRALHPHSTSCPLKLIATGIFTYSLVNKILQREK